MILNLTEITYRREGTTILDRVSWSVREGEHWAMLGANGSGKTTLLKVVTGYEWPTSGKVEVLGRRFGETNLGDLRQHIGWVSTALGNRVHGYDTAEQVAVSGLEASIGVYREFSGDEYVEARAALERIGMGGLSKRPWRVLSQGERQRVLIARALVPRPALLVLDEPCAGLDPVAREAFLNDLESLVSNPGGPAVVFVTHHIEEIRPFVTHVLVLREGRVLACGTVREAITSATMSEAFGRPCRVERTNGRWMLQID